MKKVIINNETSLTYQQCGMVLDMIDVYLEDAEPGELFGVTLRILTHGFHLVNVCFRCNRASCTVKIYNLRPDNT